MVPCLRVDVRRVWNRMQIMPCCKEHEQAVLVERGKPMKLTAAVTRQRHTLWQSLSINCMPAQQSCSHNKTACRG
jgi:cytochrome oxidase assembly protein ShyY1